MRSHLATRWRLAIGISVLTVLLAATPAMAGSIVPGVSIAGVHLGQSTAQVRRILGPPPVATPPSRNGDARWAYPSHKGLTVDFVHDTVRTVNISTVPGRGRVLDHTAEGIGLLSKMSAVAKAYPGHCDPPDPPTNPPSCGWGTFITGMGFSGSGRYGYGWKTPVESITLSLGVGWFVSRKEASQTREAPRPRAHQRRGVCRHQS